MLPKALKPIIFTVLTALIGGCASAPEPITTPSGAQSPQSLWLETDDLAMVVDTTLQVAGRYGKDQVLVVFDIDNTLLAMEQGLGSDQWYYWQKHLQEENPCSSMLVSDRFKVQGALYFASAMRPTQPDVAQQVTRLQEAGLRVISVTSRGPGYRLVTFRELRRNGISFRPGALPPEAGFSESFIPDGGARPARYEDGVFFTAGQHKGSMLKALLDKTGTPWPKVVVIADDKADNLNAMMETFMGTGTATHAWRYSREDVTVALLDREEATAQWDAIRPALMKIQQILGPDNYDLPQEAVREGCSSR